MGKILQKQAITETFIPIVEAVETDQSKLPDGIIFRAKYNICNIDELNRNNRRYRKAVWEKVDGDPEIQEKLKTRSLFGHAEHPKDTSQSSTEKISHVVTRIYNEDNKEKCDVEGLDTPYGNIVKAILKAKCGLGMSTRAEGDLEECEEDGKIVYDVIPKAYSMKAIDFTADASTYDALPESVQLDIVDVVKKGIDNEKIDRGYAAVILESLKAPKAKELRESIVHDKHHRMCACKPSEKKCTQGCAHANEAAIKEIDAGAMAGPSGVPGSNVTSAGADQDKTKARQDSAPMSPARVDTAEGKSSEEKIKNALNVIVKDPKIRDYLKKNDPKALQQAEQALGVNEFDAEHIGEPTDKPSAGAAQDQRKAETDKARATQGVESVERKPITMKDLLEKRKKKWMQKAFAKRKGALHRALGVPEDKDIPVAKMRDALHSDDSKLKKMALAAVNANPDKYGSLKESWDWSGWSVDELNEFNEIAKTNPPRFKRMFSKDKEKKQVLNDEEFGAAKDSLAAAIDQHVKESVRVINKVLEFNFLGKKMSADIVVEVSQDCIESIDIKSVKDEAGKDFQIMDEIKDAINLKLDQMELKDLEENKKGETIMKRRIREDKQNVGINFDEIYAEMQKASEEYYLGEKDKKMLTESKTTVGFCKGMLKVLSEARRDTAIAKAERDKVLEISEDKLKTLEISIKEQQKTALEEFGNRVVTEVKAIYEKKMESLKEHYEKLIKETEAKCAQDIFQKTVIDVKIKESGLELPENTVALLRQCKTPEEVDNLISKIRFDLKEGLLHSDKPGEIPVNLGEGAPKDPLLAQTERMLHSLK